MSRQPKIAASAMYKDTYAGWVPASLVQTGRTWTWVATSGVCGLRKSASAQHLIRSARAHRQFSDVVEATVAE